MRWNGRRRPTRSKEEQPGSSRRISRGGLGDGSIHIAAFAGQFTNTMPMATRTKAAMNEGVSRSPNTSQPKKTPTTGEAKVKAESSAAR